jgi:hypothetical protein
MKLLLRNALLVGGMVAGLGYSLPSYAVPPGVVPMPILPKGTFEGDGSGMPPGHRDPTPILPKGSVSGDSSVPPTPLPPIHALPPGMGCGGDADCVGAVK